MSFRSMKHGPKWTAHIGFAALLLGIACAGPKKTVKAPSGLAYRWQKGTVLRYAIDSDSQQSVETMGQTMETQSLSRMIVTVRPEEIYPDGSALLDFVIDTLTVQVKSVMGEIAPDVSALIGKHLKLRVAATGKFIGKPDSSQHLEIKLGRMGSVNLEDNFRRLFVRVPGRPVQLGETWTERDTTNLKRSGLDIALVSETKHRLVEKRPFEKRECYLIKSEGSFTMEGAGKEPMSGASMAFEGEGTSSSETYFDPAMGVLMQQDLTVNMEGTVSLSGQAEMTMPMETVSKIRVKLVPGA